MSNQQNATTFINPRFDLIRLWIQDHIGQFIVFLLVLTYLGTGFFIGISLQKGLVAVFGTILSWIAGMSLSMIAQMIRGSLVYFSQANPYRLGGNGHLIGGFSALALTIYASYEVIHLLSEQGVSQAVQISTIGVIIGGFFIECFFLNELVKINNSILVNDPDLFEMAVQNEERLTEVKTKIGEAQIKLLHARRQRFGKALNETRGVKAQPGQEHTPTPPEQPQSKGITRDELKAIIQEVVNNTLATKEKPKIITEVPPELLPQGVSLGKSNGHKPSQNGSH